MFPNRDHNNVAALMRVIAGAMVILARPNISLEAGVARHRGE